MVLLGSVICVLVPSSVCAAKSSASERGLVVLRDFFGLDLSKYDVVVEENSLYESFLGNALCETVFFSLTSTDGQIRIAFTFLNDNLQNMYVFENTETPLLKSTTKDNDVENAQIFLCRYEQYLSHPFFGSLNSTLDDVVANKNYTKPLGNAVLEVTTYDNKGVTSFMWRSVVDDSDMIPCSAFVALGFKHGVLVSFIDTWSFNDVDKTFELLGNGVVNTNVVVSSLSDVEHFDDTTILSAVGWAEYFVVVCVGSVFVAGLSLQRLKGCHFRQFFVKKGCGLLFVLLLFLVIFLPLFGSVNALPVNGGVVWGSRSSGASNDLYGSHSWRKTNAEISRQEYVTRFLESNCLVAANGYVGFSNVWANKSSILSQAQRLNADYAHVAVFDWDHGVGGYPGAILSSYSGISVDELHYMFEDDWGTFVGTPSAYDVDWSHGVYDVDIYEAFSAGQVHFAFVNTCLSANIELFGQGTSPSGYPLGMPFAFTHRMVDHVPAQSLSSLMSDDGYNCPDAFPQCYIGFPFGSAALDQYISYNGNWQPWYQWMVFFCYVAFNFDVSVNEALDWTCSMQWGCPSFGVSPLQGGGFTAIWPLWDDVGKTFDKDTPNAQGLYSTLAVYGNGNIHLKNFQASHVITSPYVNGSQFVDVESLAVFSVYSVDSFGHNIQYVFDWGDGTPQTVTDYAVAGVPVSVSHFWSTAGMYDVTVRAQCDDGIWSEWSEVCMVKVGSSYWLTIVVMGLILVGLILLVLVLVLWYRFKGHFKGVFLDNWRGIVGVGLWCCFKERFFSM